MSKLLVVAGEADPTAVLLVEAAHRLGIPVSMVDLRRDALSLEVGPNPVVTWRGEAILPPEVLVNTSSVNGLGLAGADALMRQQSARWRDRHFAAREEQGLLLAVFAHFRRHGSVLVNGPKAGDLALMPNAVIDRLHRAGISVDRKSDRGLATEILVAGGRGIIHTGQVPQPQNITTAIAVADAAEFLLGSVRMLTGSSGRSIVSGWSHRLDLSLWPQPDACATEILRSFPALEPRSGSALSHPFFVEDLA